MAGSSEMPKGAGTDWARLREIHRSIRKRCTNPNCKDFPHYGGRGIVMCKAWEDFETFYVWAMTHGYRDGLTLDRINNNRGYDPTNCRWVSRRAQAYNRTTNHYLRRSDGEIHTVEEWARILGTTPNTILNRLNRGWTPDKAVRTPVRK